MKQIQKVQFVATWVISFLVFSALLSSCASIVSRTKWPLAVDSKPEGVHVSIQIDQVKKYLRAKHL